MRSRDCARDDNEEGTFEFYSNYLRGTFQSQHEHSIMSIAVKFTRRQTLAGLAAATALPLPALGLAAENRVRGR